MYGNFYLTNNPDAILNKYKELKQLPANFQELDKMLSDYYHTVYAKDPLKLSISLQDMAFEPFRHNTINDVLSFNVSDKIKLRKSYYQLYRKTLSDSEFLSFKNIDDFNKSLDKFIKNNTQN